MKKILLVVIALAFICGIVAGQEHLNQVLFRAQRQATSAWDTISVWTGSVPMAVKVSFLNTGPDTLIITKKLDTLAANTVKLRPGMSYADDNWPLGYLRVKASGPTNIAYYWMAIGGGEVGISIDRWVPYLTIDSLTRPTDATAYATNDVVANSTTAGSVAFLNFKNAVRTPGGRGWIQSLRVCADTANVANANFILFLYKDTTYITKIADNAQMAFLPAAVLYRIIPITFSLQNTGCGTGTTAVFSYQTYLGIPYQAASEKTSIFGRLVVLGAYQPKNGGKFWVELGMLQE